MFDPIYAPMYLGRVCWVGTTFGTRFLSGKTYSGRGTGLLYRVLESIKDNAAQEKQPSPTLSIFYKRQPENVTRVSLKFFKNLPRSVSKSVS